MFTVIVVDDEYWVLYGMVNTFDWERYGFKVIHQTCDALDAWDKIQKMKPDVVFADIKMPELSGLDLLLRIRKEGINTEMVLITGYSEFEYARQAISLDVFEYCVKPVNKSDADVILDKLSRHLKRKYGMDGSEQAEISLKVNNPQFCNLIKYMNENYGSMLHITKLSKQFFIDVSYCNKLFHINFGKSFTEYITEIRMKNAKELLSKGMPVKEVAVNVGYTDYSYFMKAYKRYYSITPTEFQKGIMSNEHTEKRDTL
jgi:two-component system response regulator YesN